MFKQLFLVPTVAAALVITAGGAFAANGGPEPYSAPTPSMTPQSQEPLITKAKPDQVSLGNADDVKGPAGGPEPYHAADPVYPSSK